jgi:predicted dehydrogenase
LVLAHETGVESILSASAVVGAPGPRLRVIGSEGAFVVNELDAQEALLRAGKAPKDGKWEEDTSSQAFIHRGDSVEEFKTDPGNYASFYSLVHEAIVNKTAMPISPEEILAVAQIIDKAREINSHG